MEIYFLVEVKKKNQFYFLFEEDFDRMVKQIWLDLETNGLASFRGQQRGFGYLLRMDSMHSGMYSVEVLWKDTLNKQETSNTLIEIERYMYLKNSQ